MLGELWGKREFIYVQTLGKDGALDVLITKKLEDIVGEGEEGENDTNIGQDGFNENLHLDNIKKYQMIMEKLEN